MPKYFTPMNPLLTSAALVWLVLVLFAMNCFSKFDRAAGASGHPPTQWHRNPRFASVRLDPVKPTLVMLVHPQCPCSRASLAELNHLIASCPGQAAVFVLFLQPAGYSPRWAKTDLWRAACALPGVHVLADKDGIFAGRFGAATSGETLLYAPDGGLLYQGGLTGERGHEGDNPGLSAVTLLLEKSNGQDRKVSGQKKQAVQEPVYGCPLTADRTDQSCDRIRKNIRKNLWLP